jgi:phosphatidylinositol alpha-mannosyltransferase
MKIAVTSPFSLPYIRRGNRCAHDLATYLASQGHQVYFITAKPGVRRKRIHEKVFVEYHRIVEHPFLSLFKIDHRGTFVPSCLCSLLREEFDIVQTTFPTDAFAASLNKSIRGTPFVHLVYGCEPLHPMNLLLSERMYNRVVRSASQIASISSYVADDLERVYGVRSVVIPLAVDLVKFRPPQNKTLDPPRILCAATSITPRKRIPLLVKAFEKLIERVDNAVLQLAGKTKPEINRDLLNSVNAKTRRAIQILNVASDDALADVYRNATVSVLPSVREPFGMVITESLASGTPVVGTRSGGIPEIIDDPEVGVLFEPSDNLDELCEALLRGLDLARDPRTSKRCRQHVAERYSWKLLGPQYERLYHDALNQHGRETKRP